MRAYAKGQNDAAVIDCLAGLLGNVRVSPNEPPSKTNRAAIEPIAFAAWLQLSKIDLALTVHALTKLNSSELAILHEADYVGTDQMMYKECDSERARSIIPSDYIVMPLSLYKERVEIFMRKCIQEIQALEKHDMVAYLRKIRPHLVQD
ncbi:g7909 [Coccomyxa viridis]|uniref:G7909 protein n=1 Tax=Coccomyxa viridis TaxID=1274662 RepID=A0ABP1G069_9CHLO